MVDNYDEASREAVSVLILVKYEFDIPQQAIWNYHPVRFIIAKPNTKSRLVLEQSAGNEAKDAERIKFLWERIDEALKNYWSITRR